MDRRTTPCSATKEVKCAQEMNGKSRWCEDCFAFFSSLLNHPRMTRSFGVVELGEPRKSILNAEQKLESLLWQNRNGASIALM